MKKILQAHNLKVQHKRATLARTILYTAIISSFLTLLITAVYIDVAILQ